MRQIVASRIRTVFALALIATATSACSADTGALDPRGPVAADTAAHWWVMFWLGLVVYVVVMAILLYSIVRARRQADPDATPPISDRAFFTVGGLAIPILILAIVLGDSVRTGQSVIDSGDEPAVTIEITGHMFWWEVRYPDHDVVTANEIHVPAGQPVELVLISADVIHSFWFPELVGKLDLNPDGENITWIEANEEGEYWGQCAEFCGTQHALMGKLLIAQSPEDFEQWLADQQEPASEPGDDLLQTGMDVYFDAGCAMCHRIQGVTEQEPAAGSPGPDLTHFGSRQTIASAIEENNYGNLAAWIIDPHQLKPGVRMPATELESEELDALVEYLLSLE